GRQIQDVPQRDESLDAEHDVVGDTTALREELDRSREQGYLTSATMKPRLESHAIRSGPPRRRVRALVPSSLTLVVIGCAGGSRGSADPAKPSSTEMSAQPAATSSAPAASAEPAPVSSGRSVGTKLLRDVDASPKQFKIAPNDGHGLGAYSLAVDGRAVWP